MPENLILINNKPKIEIALESDFNEIVEIEKSLNLPNTNFKFFQLLIENRNIYIMKNDIDREIHIFSDEGRLLRPLLKVNKNKISLPKTWNNTISYIDAAEVENNAIAMHPHELQKNLYTDLIKLYVFLFLYIF